MEGALLAPSHPQNPFERPAMKPLFAGLLVGLLFLAPAFAQIAGNTPNTGPEGTGNFVSGKPEGQGNFVRGKPEGTGNFVSGKPKDRDPPPPPVK